MAKTSIIQTDFSAGEITPRMKGRVDTSRYQKGAETIENGVVAIHGGIDRRDGLRYLASAKLGAARKVRLFRYVFNTDQAYLIEFGHKYVRFFTASGAVIVSSGTTPLELVSPYTEDQLFSLRTKQGGDTMFVFHPDVPTQRLRRLSATSWTLGAVPWITEPFAEIGTPPDAGLTLSSGAVGSGRAFSTSATTVPDAPTIGTATALNGGARIAFTPPAHSGGQSITSYTATSSPGGITATGTSSPITMTGLTNGVAYTFTVKANNALGASAASAASNSVTPSASAPASSISVTATPANFSASVAAGKVLAILGPTAAASGGTAPYSYAWVQTSGNGNIKTTGGASAQLVMSSTAYGATNYATYRVTSTDANGAKGTASVNIAIKHASGGGGGGGVPA